MHGCLVSMLKSLGVRVSSRSARHCAIERKGQTGCRCQIATFFFFFAGILSWFYDDQRLSVCGFSACLLILSLWYYSASYIATSVPLWGKEDNLLTSLYFLVPGRYHMLPLVAWNWNWQAKVLMRHFRLSERDWASSHTDHKCLNHKDHSCPQMTMACGLLTPGLPEKGRLDLLSFKSNISSKLQKCIWMPAGSAAAAAGATAQLLAKTIIFIHSLSLKTSHCPPRLCHRAVVDPALQSASEREILGFEGGEEGARNAHKSARLISGM